MSSVCVNIASVRLPPARPENAAQQCRSGLAGAKLVRVDAPELSARQFLFRCIVGFLGGATVALQLLPADSDTPMTVPQGESRHDMARAVVNENTPNRFDLAFAPFSPENVIARSRHARVARATNGNYQQALTKAEVSANDIDTTESARSTRGTQEISITDRLTTASLPQPKSVPPNAASPVSTPKYPTMNPLAGKTLRYLIGADAAGEGRSDEVTEVPYGAKPAKRGISIAYCNLFDEHNTGRYGPYLKTSETARQYNEGQIDPSGPGWTKNLTEQFEQRKRQGFEYIELDNPDAYKIDDVIGAIELAGSYGLKVIAKNPGLMERAAGKYIAHPNVYGIIVEKGAGNAADMDALRRKAGKPEIPVWFVAFGSGRSWANSVAKDASNYRNMGVTYSSVGEYRNAQDVLAPNSGTGSAKI